MTSLTILPETNHSDYQALLNRLPSPNQSITEPDREKPTTVNALAKVRQRFSETLLSSKSVLQELLRAKQIWTERATSTFYFFEAELASIELIYSLRNPGEVFRYLQTNRFLAPILIEAYLEIGKYFPNQQIFLEVDKDPEESSNQQLVAFIATNYIPAEVLHKLKQLDEDWWLDAMDRAKRKLCINVEFE